MPARVAILCPEECLCDPGGCQVSCDDPSVTAVSLIHLTNVRDLRLYYNNITLFERDCFVSRGLTELEILLVFRCGLRTIELGAFNGLAKLTHLLMYDNEISEIIPGTFENMSNLEGLFFGNNGLEHLDSDVFSGLFNLKHIDLEHNKLQHLHPDTFLGLPNLQHLSLNLNRRLQIPTDRNFIKSHFLSHLSISRCNINSVSVQTFANISALEWLSLSHNTLRTVDINILKALPKVSELYLDDNLLQCDCQLQEVWRWCQEHKILTADWGYVPQCDTPSEVEGMGWGC